MTTALAKTNELDRYLAEVNRYPILTKEEETRLALRWRDLRDAEAAHALVTANLRFVVKIANEYRGYGARILDLIQEGSIGLMHGVKRFDPDRGYRLLSYAVYWIRSYIHSFLMRTIRMIKIGTSRAHRKLFFKLRSLKGKLAAGGMSSRDEIIDTVAKETGVDRKEVEEMDRHFESSDASLDAPVSESGTSLVEIMPTEGPNQEEMIAELEVEADRAALLENAMETLDPREKEIVQKRYLSEKPVQLKDIGEQMGVTKQRVSQLERRAMKKLKAALLETA
ncbi:MAG: sigma-70 family RNA polymerase sigma factor [Proteobacteria bacterium]|nr:sigma-70 family RNA polymerase sigma factor [Pseudomonadota bacterium]